MNAVERAKEAKKKINEALTRIESIDEMVELIRDKELVFLEPHEDGQVYPIHLDEVLTPEKKTHIRDYVLTIIQQGRNEAIESLERLCPADRMAEAPKEAPKAEEVKQTTIDDFVEQPEEEQALPFEEPAEEITYPEMTEPEVRSLYTEGTSTVEDLAQRFGKGKSTVYKFIKDHGLEKKKKDNTPWITRGKKGKK